MALLWGVLSPLTVILARYVRAAGRPTWRVRHQQLSLWLCLLTVAATALALIPLQQRGLPHFRSRHGQMGLAIVLMMTAQIIWALRRPPPTASRPPAVVQAVQAVQSFATEMAHPEAAAAADATAEAIGTAQCLSSVEQPHFTSAMTEAEAKPAAPLPPPPPPSPHRLIWSWSHRLAGGALLGLGAASLPTGVQQMERHGGE